MRVEALVHHVHLPIGVRALGDQRAASWLCSAAEKPAPCTLRGVVPAPAASSAAVPVALRQHDGGPVGVVLEAVCLSAEGRRHPVLDRVDLQVFPRERVCLVGDSGAGKSSLLRVIAGPVWVRRAGSAWRHLPRDVRWPWAGCRSALPSCPRPCWTSIPPGLPGIDERAIQAALEAAGLGRWLRSLPLGLHTPLSGARCGAGAGRWPVAAVDHPPAGGAAPVPGSLRRRLRSRAQAVRRSGMAPAIGWRAGCRGRGRDAESAQDYDEGHYDRGGRQTRDVRASGYSRANSRLIRRARRTSAVRCAACATIAA